MTISLKDAIAKFTDNLGRTDLKPVDGGINSTNNALLYTGELAILMHDYSLIKTGFFDRTDYLGLLAAVNRCRVPRFPGLYSRHPEPYRFKKDENGRINFRPLSFDEVLGVSFLAGLTDTNLSNSILKYGQNNHWQYNDVPGEEVARSIGSMFEHPITLFKTLRAYIKEANTFEKDGFRKASQYYNYLFPMFFTHSKSNRIIYKASAGKASTIGEQLSLLSSVIVASLQKENISTKVLWYFRLRHLQIMRKETSIIKLARTIFTFAEKKRFGDAYLREIFKLYYKDADHPFHQLIKYSWFR